MTKQKSPFEERLRALIEAESDKRKGRFTAKEFCESVGISPQAITSMRKGVSIKTLENIVLQYPHWNILYLIAEKGEMFITEPKAVIDVQGVEAELTGHVLDLIDGGRLFTSAYVRKLEDERDECHRKSVDLEVQVKQLEQRLGSSTQGDRPDFKETG